MVPISGFLARLTGKTSAKSSWSRHPIIEKSKDPIQSFKKVSQPIGDPFYKGSVAITYPAALDLAFDKDRIAQYF